LRETSGASSAWIQRIVVQTPVGTDESSSCWGDAPRLMRVPPGGTLEVNDETFTNLFGSACRAPIVRAAEEPFQFQLLVTFTDGQLESESTVGASLTVKK
jgi:hypothetical protein